MNEQRSQAHWELIQALLACPNGEEDDVLNAHHELMDMELVAKMEYLATHMLVEGHTDSAKFLRGLTTDVANFIQIQFWHSLVKTLLDEENNKNDITESILVENLYSLMRDNLVQVNKSLAEAMFFWAEGRLAQYPENAEYFLGLLNIICSYIQEFSYGKFREVNEIALAGYNYILDHIEDNSRQYAQTLTSRGMAYKDLAHIGVDGVLGDAEKS